MEFLRQDPTRVMSDTWWSDTVKLPMPMAMSRSWPQPSPRTARARRCQPFLDSQSQCFESFGAWLTWPCFLRRLDKWWSVTLFRQWKIPASLYIVVSWKQCKNMKQHKMPVYLKFISLLPQPSCDSEIWESRFFKTTFWQGDLAKLAITNWWKPEGIYPIHVVVNVVIQPPYSELSEAKRNRCQQTIRKIVLTISTYFNHVEVWPICGIGVWQMLGCWLAFTVSETDVLRYAGATAKERWEMLQNLETHIQPWSTSLSSLMNRR